MCGFCAFRGSCKYDYYYGEPQAALSKVYLIVKSLPERQAPGGFFYWREVGMLRNLTMKNQINIRKAVENDVAAMVELWKEMMDFHKELDQLFTRKATGHEGWTDFITGHISNDDSCVLVAECNNQIVGQCLGFVSEYPPGITSKRYGKFQELAVTAKFRRFGIGEKLFSEMVTWFREHGIKRTQVRVSVHNELLTAFWRKMGFRPYAETLFLEI